MIHLDKIEGECRMKKTVRVCYVGCTLILCAVVLVGCDDLGSGCPEYVGEGFWPAYEGAWQSIQNAAGDKNKDEAYLDIYIESDGTFSGVYYDYVYDYTWQMPTHWGNIPVPVYNPGGQARSICGLINFAEENGIVNFLGVGETTFYLVQYSDDDSSYTYADDRFSLVFPQNFYYSEAYARKH